MKTLYWDAINPFTGQPFTLDDPNLRWGEPSYYLEPGDPGFVPYTNTTPTIHTKPRRMKRNAYYPTSVPEQVLWLTNFFLKLLLHGATLGVSATQIAATVADCRWLIYLLGTYRPAERAAAKANTDFLREAQSGIGDTVLTLPDFDPPPLPAADPGNPDLPAVVARKPGALNRIFSLIQIIKESPACTEAIATDLDILGTETAPPPPSENIQPTIKVKRSGAHILIEWSWNGLRDHVDMLQIQVDRGTGWTDLVYDSTPDYTDTHPHPATLTTWKYRAIWRADEVQIGLWSAEQSIVVGGN